MRRALLLACLLGLAAATGAAADPPAPLSGWSDFTTGIGGQSAYRDGELVYQDYVYDDEGATGTPVATDPTAAKQFGGLSRPSGTYRYP